MKKLVPCLSVGLLVLAVTLIATLISAKSVVARPSTSDINRYDQNSIFFYDPNGGEGCGDDVSVIGDSITYLGTADLQALMPKVDINGSGGRLWGGTGREGEFGGMHDSRNGVTVLKDLISEGKLRKNVVFAVGTNNNGSFGTYLDQAAINEVCSLTEGHELFFVTNRDYYNTRNFEGHNNALFRNSGCAHAHVVDWYRIIGSHDGSYWDLEDPNQMDVGNDNPNSEDPSRVTWLPHPNAIGLKLWAQSIFNALAPYTDCDGGCVDSSTIDFTGKDEVGGKLPVDSTVEANVRMIIDNWSGTLMNMQRKYGFPWDVAIAVIIKENSAGTNPNAAVNQYADWNYYSLDKQNADGVTFGDRNIGDKRFAVFNSFQSATDAFGRWYNTTPNMRRRYEEAFSHLDPNNYDVDGFITAFLEKYAPRTENNTDLYISQAKERVHGLIANILAEKNLPDSATLAKREQIPIYGTGSDAARGGSDNEVICDDGDPDGYVFPLAGAKKSNYLNPGGSVGTSVLSPLPCADPESCHHDYVALDMGLRKSLVDGSEYTAETSGAPGYDDYFYYSMGVKVLAFTSGTITSYNTYSRAVDGWEDKCASVTFLGDNGEQYWLGHMSYDTSRKAGDHFNAGDVIGEVGPPQCAIGTQSHLHINMYKDNNSSCGKSNPSNCSTKVVEIMNELYNKLPE